MYAKVCRVRVSQLNQSCNDPSGFREVERGKTSGQRKNIHVEVKV